MKLNLMFPNSPDVFDEKKCFDYLDDNGVFYREMTCPRCNRRMSRNITRGCFRCTAHNCRYELSLRHGTFFEGTSLKLSKILRMAWQWLNGTPVSSFPRMFGCSFSTSTKFATHFRKLVESTFTEEDSVIGGDGVIVELDEAKFGKRKYHRGHRVDGVWVLGGVERENSSNSFFVTVSNRNAETLIGIILQHVRPGSTIITDLWKGYNPLSDFDYTHLTVNHSTHFRDPESGAHTNTIEGMWNGLKLQIRPRNRTRNNIQEHLWEKMWRKKNKRELWNGFMNALRDIHYTLE